MGKIIIVGPSGSGKDFLRKKFERKGFSYATPYTTRPRRENEVEGLDYHFILKSEFERMIDMGLVFNYQNFNDWYYGIKKSQWASCNLFIMSPAAINSLSEEERESSTIIYLNIPVNIRFDRITDRKTLGDNPGDSIKRRIQADALDFANFTNYDIEIKNENF